MLCLKLPNGTEEAEACLFPKDLLGLSSLSWEWPVRLAGGPLPCPPRLPRAGVEGTQEESQH